MNKWLKTAFLAAPLIGAGYFFGTICKQIARAYELILAPSGELLIPLLWFLLALGTMMVSAGLVVALLRPVWVGITVFALSGLAMLLAWQVTLGSGILVLLYLIAASLCAVGVAKELNERVRFSVRPIGEGQAMLRMTLILVSCGSLYFGYAAHVEREGFSIPESYIELFMEQMEKQMMVQMPEEGREESVAQFREEFRSRIDDFVEQTLKPYEQFIPLGLAVSLFMPLVSIVSLLAWVPTMVLNLIFPLLTMLGVTEVITETQEVQRLTIA